MSFTEYIRKMKEMGWREEDLKEDYRLYESSRERGYTLPWQLFLKPCFRR